jgi:hypothetical protein
MKAKANICFIRDIIFQQRDLLLLPDPLRSTVQASIADGWRFHIVKQSCGRCYYRDKIVTLPEWVCDKIPKDFGYFVWYTAHETAHIKAGFLAKHGPLFMHHLKLLCPAIYIHHELGYKPRNATAAGISQIISEEDI